MAVHAQSPLVEGNPAASVRVVIYEDLQCPDCATFRVMLDEKLLPKYGARVAFEHRDFPLTKHAWAKPAAIAARYFQGVKPELGAAFRRETLARLREIKADTLRDHITAFARKHGAAAAKALAALDDPVLTAAVERDVADGVARGIAKTPTALVNGEPFVETFTFAEISKSIEAQLQ
jgi:protein-disulfide isomerase